MFNFKFLTAGATSLALLASAAMSETVIRLQSVLPVTGDEVRMVEAEWGMYPTVPVETGDK